VILIGASKSGSAEAPDSATRGALLLSTDDTCFSFELILMNESHLDPSQSTSVDWLAIGVGRVGSFKE